MKYSITYFQENCSGCLRCMLTCSRAYTKQYQPSSARLIIDSQEPTYRATFTEECNSCGICVDNCMFGALIKQGNEEIV